MFKVWGIKQKILAVFEDHENIHYFGHFLYLWIILTVKLRKPCKGCAKWKYKCTLRFKVIHKVAIFLLPQQCGELEMNWLFVFFFFNTLLILSTLCAIAFCQPHVHVFHCMIRKVCLTVIQKLEKQESL